MRNGVQNMIKPFLIKQYSEHDKLQHRNVAILHKRNAVSFIFKPEKIYHCLSKKNFKFVFVLYTYRSLIIPKK